MSTGPDPSIRPSLDQFWSPGQVGARIQIDWDGLAGLDSADLREFLTRYDPVREGLFPPAGDVGHHDQTWANTARELVTPRHANLGDGSIIFDEGMAVTGTPEFVELPDDPVFVELPDDAIVLRRARMTMTVISLWPVST